MRLGDTVFEGLEGEAREAKKGLWADPQPVPPLGVAEENSVMLYASMSHAEAQISPMNRGVADVSF